jgi:histidine triad (HIT) family protein
MDPTNDTIFSKIIRRELPATIVYETEEVLAFRDINPAAPYHVLVVPKKPVPDIVSAEKALLGELFHAAGEIARRDGLAEDGFRLVVNTGRSAGQTVFHLHLHLLAGRELVWPPG